jgi:prevent-host-death family protein
MVEYLSILSILSIMDNREKFMRTVSATDAKQRLAALLDAAQREPVMIRRQNRDVAVLLSPHEYDRLRALNTDEFQRFCDRIGERAAERGLTEDKLAEILAE